MSTGSNDHRLHDGMRIEQRDKTWRVPEGTSPHHEGDIRRIQHASTTHDKGIDSLYGADSLIGASTCCDWDSGPAEPSNQDIDVGSSEEEEGVGRLHRRQRQ